MYWKCYSFEYNDQTWSKFEYFFYSTLDRDLKILNRIVKSEEEFKTWYDKNKQL